MSARCRQHYRLYCPATNCVSEAERARKSSSSTQCTADTGGAGEIGINTEGNLTMGVGGGVTVDMTDGSVGFRTSPGFSIDTPTSSDSGGGSSYSD